MSDYTIKQLTTELASGAVKNGYATAVASGDAGAVAAILNDVTISSHVALTPLTVAGVLGGLGTTAQKALWDNPNAPALLDSIHGQDREKAAYWAGLALAAGAFTQPEFDAIATALTATSTQACSRAVELWGVPVSVDDVALTMRTR